MTRNTIRPLPALIAFLLFFLAVLPTRLAAQSAEMHCSERIFERYERVASDPLSRVAWQMCRKEAEGELRRSGVPYEIMVETALEEGPEAGLLGEWITQVRKGLTIADAALIKLGPDARIVGRERPVGSSRYERKKIIVILASENERTLPEADAYTEYSDGDCYLVILPRSRSLLTEDGAMAFIMSHELFHCVQHFSLDADSWPKSQFWWVESSAHWFAHMAQPAVVVETYSQSANKFERESNRKTLDKFEYAIWPFFAWYAQEKGNARAVMQLMGRMPEGKHDASTIAGLLPPKEWDAFARAYSAYQIRVTDRVPVDPRPRAALPITEIDLPEVGDEREYRFRRRTGALERYRITLHPGEWVLSTHSPGAMYLAPMPEGGGDPAPDWTEISAESGVIKISVPCEEQRDFALVGFGSAEGSPPFVLKAQKGADTCTLSCDKVPESRDSCLIGLWEDSERVITRDLRQRMDGLAAQARAHGGNFELQDPIITFFPDSNIVTTDVIMRGDTGRGMRGEIHAQGTALWGTSGGRLVICPQGVEMTTTISAGGRSRRTHKSFPADKTWKDKIYRYECSDSRLRLTDTATGDSGAMHRR